MRQLNTIIKIFLLFLLQISSMPSQAAEDKLEKLIFGVHPYLHASTLIERFTPLTKYLGAQMDQDIRIRVGKNYIDHLNAIKEGKVDFAFLGPALFIKLTQNKTDFTLLGRLSFSGKDTFRGAIIVRKDSPVSSISELRGKQFAFGDPDSTLSSRLPEHMLHDAGVKLTDLAGYSHLKNHHNVALAVLLGEYDAGAVKEEVLREYESRGLKVIQWSPDIPTHLFVARPGLPQQKIDQLSSLLQNLHRQTIGASNILPKIKKGTTAIIPAKIEEYAELRKIISPMHITHLEEQR